MCLSVYVWKEEGRGGVETAVLVVHVSNYLIVLCSRVDEDGIDNNCARLF